MEHPILHSDSYPASWRFVVGNLGSHTKTIQPEEMVNCVVRQDEGTVTVVWKGHPSYGTEFCVCAVFRLSDDGLTECEISFSGWESDFFVEEIHFPVFDFDGSSMDFFNTYNLGSVSREVPEPAEVRPLMHMQFFAASNGKFGIYCECRDKEHFTKSRLLERLPDGNCRFRMIFHMPCGKIPYKKFTLPYSCRFGVFRGSWFEATQIYRKWACSQSWFTGRTKENPLRKIGLWVWNRGPSKTVVPPVLALAAALPGVPIALDWYWWHHNPYDTDYPGFWPPREGVEPFREAVIQLKEHGVFVQTYLNGTLWDSDSPSWEYGGADEVIRLRNGEPHRIAFNRYNHHRLGFICGTNSRFTARLTEEIRHLYECALDGQYLDVIGCIDRFLCYNPAHHHSRNGGNYIVNGYRRLIQHLISEFPNYPFSTEYCNESFMDLFDGMIACGSVSAEHFGNEQETPLPLFPAVYHGRNATALFGNYAHPDGIMPWDPLWPAEDRWKKEKKWHELYPEQFFIEVIRDVIWGLQPMVCNLGNHIFLDSTFAYIRNFIIETARFYYANREFLFDGTMESPEGFECGESEVEFLARMIFTRETECKVIHKRLPSIVHAVWRSPEGKRALFLGNYTGKTQNWRFHNCYGSVSPHTCTAIRLC